MIPASIAAWKDEAHVAENRRLGRGTVEAVAVQQLRRQGSGGIQQPEQHVLRPDPAASHPAAVGLGAEDDAARLVAEALEHGYLPSRFNRRPRRAYFW